MIPTLALEITPPDPSVYGYGIGGAGLLWFLYNNRTKIASIASAIWSLVGSFRNKTPDLPVPQEAPPEVKAAQEAEQEAFSKALAAVRSLNKAELDLIASGQYAGLASLAAAREVLPLKSAEVTDDQGIIDTLYICCRYFRSKNNKSGLDAVIAAYKALTPAAQPEVKA